jgi:hypothetical protein
MQEFKSPISRLARLFQQGRDNWREKALEKQAKVRALEIKVRDLSDSRENWKARAMAAERTLKEQNSQGDLSGKKQKIKLKEKMER